MEALDLRAALSGLTELAITPEMTEEDAERSMRFIGVFNQCQLGVVRFSGQTPWERHPDGDELLQVIEGEVEVTVLTDGVPTVETVHAGSMFVVPRGLWHRQQTSAAMLLFATAVETTEHSWADEPGC